MTHLLAFALTPPRFVDFAGFRWEVRDSGGARQGPGPNLFSPTPQDVWVDAKGLHLTISHRDGAWRCSQVVLDRSLGHGSYRFTLASPVDRLDPNVVLGLFTWDDAEEDAHREIDFEFSRWGDPLRSNGQFVVQPYDTLGNIVRYEMPAAPSVHQFEWLPESVAFSSRTVAGKIVAEHVFAHGIPRPGAERAMINLWLNEGKPPRNGKPVEVVISGFEFVPAPAGKRRAAEHLTPTGPLRKAGTR